MRAVSTAQVLVAGAVVTVGVDAGVDLVGDVGVVGTSISGAGANCAEGSIYAASGANGGVLRAMGAGVGRSAMGPGSGGCAVSSAVVYK
jgi:hypothetical protein